MALAEGRGLEKEDAVADVLSDELEATAPLEQPFAPSGLTPREVEVLLQLMDEFPTTPSGKVQKFHLRHKLNAAQPAEAAVAV